MSTKGNRLDRIEELLNRESISEPSRQAFKNEEERNKYYANLLAVSRSCRPGCQDCLTISELCMRIYPDRAEYFREQCRAEAEEILAFWNSPEAGTVHLYGLGPWPEARPPRLQRFDVSSDFGECTNWIAEYLPDIPLQHIREAALQHILKVPHRIMFFLEDFGLEGWRDRVLSSPGVIYDHTSEDYRRVQAIRAERLKYQGAATIPG